MFGINTDNVLSLLKDQIQADTDKEVKTCDIIISFDKNKIYYSANGQKYEMKGNGFIFSLLKHKLKKYLIDVKKIDACKCVLNFETSQAEGELFYVDKNDNKTKTSFKNLDLTNYA